MTTEPTANILVVDDDQKTLLAMEALLSGPGRKIITAASGREALRHLLHHEVALILLDVRMPDIDGFEAAALIRQRERLRHIPIIFLSAIDTLEEDVYRGVASGAVDYLFKPVVPQVLQAKVSIFVELFRINEHLKQQAVRKSEEQFRLVIESLQDYAVFTMDPEGRITTWNQGAQRIKGFQSAEIIGQPVARLYTPEDQANGLPQHALVRAAAENHYEEDAWRVRKDGSRFWANTIITALRDEQGNLVGFSKVTRDLTERKQAEERFRLAVEASPNAMIMVAKNGLIVFVNAQSAKLFGYTREELIGQLVDRLVPERFRVQHSGFRTSFFSDPRSRPMGRGRDLHGLRKDGSEVPVEIGLTPIETNEGKFVLASIIDITERKRAEEELRMLNSKLEERVVEQTGELVRSIAQREKLQEQLLQAQKMESIGTLAGGIAHDFNNLLNLIVGYASLLQQSSANPAQISASVEVIKETVQRGSALVQQLLALARKTETKFERIDLNRLLKSLQTLLQETFPKTIDVSLHLETDIPALMGDPNQLHQAMLNLCLNSRDAMRDGGELLLQTGRISGADVRAHFQEAREEQYVCLRVTDMGHGIDRTIRARIFEPFFTTKPQGQGTGLGLSVVYGIVISHGGFIDLASEPGRGTTFDIYLPVPGDEAVVVSGGDGLQEKPGEPMSASGVTILFAEDEVRQLHLMQKFLGNEGFTVLAARDGAEAVEMYLRHKDEIALVILDLGLPKVNGWEAYKLMKEVEPTVKAIFATGFMSPEIEAEIKKEELTAVITKPYELRQALAQICTVLQKPAGSITVEPPLT
jgi:PAS domain S-box-containing protein